MASPYRQTAPTASWTESEAIYALFIDSPLVKQSFCLAEYSGLPLFRLVCSLWIQTNHLKHQSHTDIDFFFLVGLF